MAAPDIADYEELDLTGMEIDSVSWKGERLTADFGGGRGASARVGPAHGLWGWTIESAALPDDESYGNLISSKPRFEYYTDFIRRHTLGSQEIFLIDFRGRKYHASFEDNDIGGSMHTYDLFDLGGVKIKMRTVQGFFYGSHGNVIDPSFLGTDVWAWYKADEYTTVTGDYRLDDQSGNNNHITSDGSVVPVSNVVNGLGVMRMNSGTADGLFSTTADPTIYEALFLLKVREATFSTNQGIMTGSAAGAAMVGANGATKLVNQAFGGTYTFRKNGVAFAEADQQCPMNDFGVIHGIWENGISITNLQFGKDRNNASTFLKADVAEVILRTGSTFSDELSEDLDGYLMRRGNIA